LKSPISLCCAQSKDEGLYLLGAFEFLADLQNRFLDQVAAIAASSWCPSLLYLKRGDSGGAVLRACPLLELREGDVVVYAWRDEILKYSQLNLEYGKGKEVLYNYSKIELELAHSLVSGKSFIDLEDLKEFEYHRELFHGFSTILQDVKAKVPQEKLPYAKVEALKSDSRVADNATHILAAFDFVMTFVKKTPASPTQTIGEYCQAWQLDQATTLHLRISSIVDVQLQYLVCLYEEVEDIIASRVVEWLPQSYTKPMTDNVKGDFVKFSSSLVHDALMITLKRFIFRYLSVEKISPNKALADYVLNLLLCWPHEVPINEEQIASTFPRSLLIEHTYVAYSLLREKQETQQKKQVQAGEKPKRSTTVARRRRDDFSSM